MEIQKEVRKTIKYWANIISEALLVMWGNSFMKGLLVKFLLATILACASTIFFFINLASKPWVDQTWEQAIYSGVFLVFAGVLIIPLGFISLAYLPAKQDEEQREVIESYRSKKMRLSVFDGGRISENAGGGIPRMYLMVDVVNDETRKLVDVEAYLTEVLQWTEGNQDKVNSYSFRTTRLQWKDGSFVVELKPGFPETKLKISMLNCFNSEFMFVHEGALKILPSLQQNALYQIGVRFRGRLDEDPEYRSYLWSTRFICLPKNCKLDYLSEGAAEFPDLPASLKEKIGLLPTSDNDSSKFTP